MNTFCSSIFLSRIYAKMTWKAIAIPVCSRYFLNISACFFFFAVSLSTTWIYQHKYFLWFFMVLFNLLGRRSRLLFLLFWRFGFFRFLFLGFLLLGLLFLVDIWLFRVLLLGLLFFTSILLFGLLFFGWLLLFRLLLFRLLFFWCLLFLWLLFLRLLFGWRSDFWWH